jgi:parvulin-like peptidyl-prolyl isomerase
MRRDRRYPTTRHPLALALALLLAAVAAVAVAAPVTKTSRTSKAAAKAAPAARPTPPRVSPDSVLATIGDRVISMADLEREWDQLPPSMRPKEPSPVTARQMLLEDLVTRDLLGLEAARHPRPMTSEEEAEYAKYRETLMKNELYKQEVVGGIHLENVDRGLFRKQMTTILFLRAFTFDDRDAAQAWNTRIVGGTPLARLEALAQSGAPGAPQSLDLGYKIREEFTDSVAAVLFTLPLTRLSPPLPYEGKWALFQVTSSRPRPNGTDFDDEAGFRSEFLRVAAVERREAYRAQLARQMNVHYDYAGVDTLLNRFQLVPTRIQTQDSGPGNVNMNLPLPPVSEADLDLLLATTLEGKVLARDLILYLADTTPALRPEIRNREQMLPWVDRIAFDKELMRRAVARGLEHETGVARDLALRREKYLVEALYADSVAARVSTEDDSLRAMFYADSTRYAIPDQARVWVCVTETQTRADSVLGMARQGVDLEQLARDWSIAPNATAGGMSEPISPGQSEEPELDRAIFSTPVGGFAGPLATAQGYAILKILERTPGAIRSFTQAYQDLVTGYRMRDEERQMQGFVARLRQRYPVLTHASRVADMVR